MEKQPKETASVRVEIRVKPSDVRRWNDKIGKGRKYKTLTDLLITSANIVSEGEE